MVSFPDREARVDIEEILRAVAMTWSPDLWNSAARALPIPPLEQPVMRTVLLLGWDILLIDVDDFGFCVRLDC